MTYMAVKDLKKTKDLWETLGQEREIVITKDGMPCAILVDVAPDMGEEALAEIRRALFSAAIARARRKGEEIPPSPQDIDAVIRLSREERDAS